MLTEAIIEERVEQLCSSPAGCVLLLKVEAGELTPEQVVDPVISMLLVSSAVGEITPWRQDHDWLVERALAEGGGSKRRELAHAILAQPGIEQWWASLRRDSQMWIQPGPDKPFPPPAFFPTPQQAPDEWEIYAQSPEHRISTSTRIEGWTSQLADTVAYMNGSDWIIQYPAAIRLVQIRDEARIFEVVTANDWHTLAATYPTSSDPTHPVMPDAMFRGSPWGSNDGIVPNWREVAREWDGVHVTLWAFLTATQVPVSSASGWSEAWSWGGEETTWLRWAFDRVDELPSLIKAPPALAFPMPSDMYMYPPIDNGTFQA